MSDVRHISRVCARCGTQLKEETETCPWCGTPASGAGSPPRLRVRKRRGVFKKYVHHIRRHWIYFFLAILIALLSAWILLDYSRRPARQGGSVPGHTIGHAV
jgi:predicted amidophosphoribosyltransferase